MWNVAQRLAKPLQHLPGTCQVCQRWPAQPVCEHCVTRHAPERERCRTCARPLTGGATHCGECLTRPGGPVLKACVAAVDYAYPWDNLIARFKFREEPGLAGPLAALMRNAPGAQALLEQADAVIPIPVSRDRLAQRGYNQAWELIKGLRLTEAGSEPALALPDALERLGDTPDQHRLGLDERIRNLASAFKATEHHTERLRKAHVVLVDDVCTTGTTLRSAAEALLSAGVRSVSALVLARTDLS